MSYIGVPPVTGDFVVLDNITTSATASYTLQRNSANFVPESANHMLVSLNGTIQKPNSSFTISGSTITFSSALTSSDAIDFILVLGNVNAVGVATTVSDNAITNAKTDFVSTSSGAGLQIKGDGTTDGTLQLNCSQNTHGVKIKSPAHSAGQSYTLTLPTTAPSANKFLQTDGSGNLSFASAGIAEADQWLLTSAVSYSGSQNTTVTANLARSSGDFNYIGTGMSQSSGVFTFPSTGIWQITSQAQMYSSPAESTYTGLNIQVDSGDGSFTERAENYVYIPNVGSPTSAHMTAYCSVFVDVTDASAFKVRFQAQSGNSFVLNGNGSKMRTGFTFIRLGDT